MINTTYKSGSFHILTVIFIVWVSFFDTVSAQIADQVNDKSIFRGTGGVTFGGVAQYWNVTGLGTIAQQSTPLSISVPLANRMLLSISTSGMNTSTTAKVDSSINGFVDTRFSLSYVLPGDRIWLVAGFNLPTGRTKLDQTELQMTSLISQTAFNYKVPTFGQGVNANFGMVYAGTITRRLVMGVGASYNFKGEYEPINISPNPKYNPGDEISANFALNYLTYSKNARLSADVTVTYFLEDKINDVAKYQSGSRAIGLIAYSLKTGSVSHVLQTRLRYRLPNRVFGNDTTEYKSSTQVEGQYSLSLPVNEWLSGTLITEYKSYSADQTIIAGNLVETGKAGIAVIGCDAGFLFSDFIFPTLSIRYSTGTIVYEGNQYTVNGVDIGVGVKISL